MRVDSIGRIKVDKKVPGSIPTIDPLIGKYPLVVVRTLIWLCKCTATYPPNFFLAKKIYRWCLATLVYNDN